MRATIQWGTANGAPVILDRFYCTNNNMFIHFNAMRISFTGLQKQLLKFTISGGGNKTIKKNKKTDI